MSADELHFLEIAELSRLLAARKVSPVELTEAMLRRIERVDPALKSYALVTPELALAQARAAEQMIGRRQILSQLHGVPVAVKDLCWTEGIATAAGMPLHRDFIPARRRDRREEAPRGGRGPARQAPAHRRRVRRSPSRDRAAGQSVAPRPLVGCVVERIGRRDRGGPVLRVAGLRHRRLDPLSFGGQRRHRTEADLGARLALRLLRARRIARPHRPDVPERDRRGDRPRRDRRQRSRTTRPRSSPTSPTTSPATTPRCAACASASTSTTRSTTSRATCAARSKRRSRPCARSAPRSSRCAFPKSTR